MQQNFQNMMIVMQQVSVTSTSVSKIHGIDKLQFVAIQRRKAYEDELMDLFHTLFL